MNKRHPLLHEWQQRLNQVNEKLASPTRSTWLWEIRAKILKYFLSRYGHSNFSERQVNQILPRDAIRTPARRPAFIAPTSSHRPRQELKRRETIRKLLEDIRQTVHPTPTR